MMTLRDQFAMAAMQGLLASGDSWNYNTIGLDAYSIADTMLAEREKNEVVKDCAEMGSEISN